MATLSYPFRGRHEREDRARFGGDLRQAPGGRGGTTRRAAGSPATTRARRDTSSADRFGHTSAASTAGKRPTSSATPVTSFRNASCAPEAHYQRQGGSRHVDVL